LLIVLPTVFILLGLAGFFLWTFMEYRRSELTQPAATTPTEPPHDLNAANSSAETNPVILRPTVAPPPPAVTLASPASATLAAEISPASTRPTATNAPTETSANPPSATPAGTNAPALAVASSNAPPLFRLQGIYYSRSHPAALINGKALVVGETVGGARVIRIERESVTLEQEGKTNVLRVP
jgi:cytoskeletal protein RodZ